LSNSKWIKDLRVSAECIQLLAETTDGSLCVLGLKKVFLDNKQEKKDNIHWISSKLKTFVLQRISSTG
jgi:hypothetical protein